MSPPCCGALYRSLTLTPKYKDRAQTTGLAAEVKHHTEEARNLLLLNTSIL